MILVIAGAAEFRDMSQIDQLCHNYFSEAHQQTGD